MFDVDDTAPDTPAPRELSQDVQALINNGLDFTESSAGARTLVVGLQPEKANKKAGLPSR